MRIAILTPIRLIGEGIAASLRACDAGFEPTVVCEVRQLRTLVASAAPPRLAIVDVTQALPLDPIREFHFDVPELPLLALGIREQDAEIIAHGSAGFRRRLPADTAVAPPFGLSGRRRCMAAPRG